MINYETIKRQILAAMIPRATTRRTKEILLEEHGIELPRWEMWEWLNIEGRRHRYEAQLAAAYMKAIQERAENFDALVKPQRDRMIKAAKMLVAEVG